MWTCRRQLWWPDQGRSEPGHVEKVEPRDLLMLRMWRERKKQGKAAKVTLGSWPELLCECISSFSRVGSSAHDVPDAIQVLRVQPAEK